MSKKVFPIIFTSILLLLPIVVVAAGFEAGPRPASNLTADNQWLTGVITGIISFLWILFIAFAIIMFIVAGFPFLSAQGEPEGIKKAQKSILWGAIGIFLGIVAFLLPFVIRFWVFPV